MTTPNAAYLSAISLMLAAYGFVYNFYRERIEEGLAVGEPKPARNALEDQIATVKKARRAARWFGFVALAVGAVFLPPLVEEIEAAFRLDFSLSHYSAIDTAFCLVAGAWFVIAFIVLRYWLALRKDLGKLEGKLKKPTADTPEPAPARPV